MKAVAYEPRLRSGATWDAIASQNFNPKAQRKQDKERLKQTDLPRLEKLALLAWPKMSARFKIGAGFKVDMTTGKWIDPKGVCRGVGIVSLVAHIARSSLLDAANMLLKVIRVRSCVAKVEPKPEVVDTSEPVVESAAIYRPAAQLKNKSKASRWKTSISVRWWLQVALPVVKYARAAAAAANFAMSGG